MPFYPTHKASTSVAMKRKSVDEDSDVEEEVGQIPEAHSAPQTSYELFERGIVEADITKVEEAIHQELLDNENFRFDEDDHDDWVTELLGSTDPWQRKNCPISRERVELLKSRAQSGFLQAALRALFDHGFDFVYSHVAQYDLLSASGCAKAIGLHEIEFALEQMALEQQWRPRCVSAQVEKRHKLWQAKKRAHESYDWEAHDKRCEHGGGM